MDTIDSKTQNFRMKNFHVNQLIDYFFFFSSILLNSLKLVVDKCNSWNICFALEINIVQKIYRVIQVIKIHRTTAYLNLQKGSVKFDTHYITV